MIDWLIYWMLDWLIDWLINRLIDWSIDYILPACNQPGYVREWYTTGCYKLLDEKLKFEEAEHQCIQDGAAMWYPYTDSNNDYIYEFVQELLDMEGKVIWILPSS